jgi:hypothetical protein
MATITPVFRSSALFVIFVALSPLAYSSIDFFECDDGPLSALSPYLRS